MPRLFLVAGAGAATATSFAGTPAGLPSGIALVAGVALGVDPYGVAMVAWDLALRTGPTALIGSLAHAVEVVAAAFLVIAGATAPDWPIAVAAMLVVAGSFMARR